VSVMRTAFVAMWSDPKFLADYSRVIKAEPILVSGAEGQAVLSGIAQVPGRVKEFLLSYTSRLTSK
jgi:hypothetical protein